MDSLASLSMNDMAALLIGFAVLLLIGGIGGMVLCRDRAVARMRALRQRVVAVQLDKGPVRLTKTSDVTPDGLLKSLIPEDRSERVQIQLQLAQAGFEGDNAVRNFFLFRLFLALLGPALLFGLMGLGKIGLLPGDMTAWMAGFGKLRLLQTVAVSIAVGFYGPTLWLKSRIASRQRRIEDGFPNALDLLQISVEAGLGFDAALARVGRELAPVAPEISYELLLAQQEVLAGRDREQAMTDMARRMGIAEAQSFVNVVAQSLQFGTSLTEALTQYAVEMRTNRELRAQEKANKLPVQMSAVMALLMLPALFLITLTPIVIRYMGIYSQ